MRSLLRSSTRGQLVYDHAGGGLVHLRTHAWSTLRRSTAPPDLGTLLAAAYLAAGRPDQGELDQEADDSEAKTMIQKTVDLLIERAKKLRSVSRINNVLTTWPKSCSASRATSGTPNPWLLGVENGVLDLRSGQLRDGRPADYIRTVAPTKWRGLRCTSATLGALCQRGAER
jgi:hypothetical protein